MTFTTTRRASYSGFIVMAILTNLSPLLFIIFQDEFGLSYERLGILIFIFFAIQIAIMGIGIFVVEKIGYKLPMIASQLCSAVGLVLLGVLPSMMNNAYAGLVIAITLNAVGCGLIELVSSPVMNALPTPANQKASAMSFLHSFYCWGVAVTIIASTIFLHFTNVEMWWALPIIWALLPLCNMVIFVRAPFPEHIAKRERMPIKDLFTTPLFILLIVIMVCGASSEVVVAQWASLFMERGIGLTKLVGDIAGPCLFAILMGLGRILYSVLSNKVKYKTYMTASALLCVACYLLMSLSSHPVFSLIGCAMTGLAASMMWPGTLSYAVSRFPSGGTLLFGSLSFFGLLGCAFVPWLAGVVADNSAGGLRTGILVATIFPAVIIFLIIAIRNIATSDKNCSQKRKS